jgi:hypothetical protein
MKHLLTVTLRPWHERIIHRLMFARIIGRERPVQFVVGDAWYLFRYWRNFSLRPSTIVRRWYDDGYKCGYRQAALDEARFELLKHNLSKSAKAKPGQINFEAITEAMSTKASRQARKRGAAK